ncbi:excinuclease ABC subunit UvrC [bacterium]
MLEDKLNRVPKKPGVYLLKDAGDTILYVGKAKILRQRLRSHFRPGKKEDRRHRLLMNRVRDFEVIVTDSEVEALILEANFVKEHRPRYNVDLKDDKSYPYIRVTSEPYPRVFITRKIIRDGSRYFGPYTEAGNIRQLMTAVRRIFPVRTCQLRINEDSIRKKRHKVCLNYHIGRCWGPCEGLVPHEEYCRIVKQVVAFVQGKNNQLVEDLTLRMKQLAGEQQFEEATLLRNEIRSISKFQSRQKVVDDTLANRDLITVASQEEDACGVVFNVREGKITNRQHFYLTGADTATKEEIVASFLKQYYLRAEWIPKEVFIQMDLSELDEIQVWLSRKRGKKVIVTIPKKGRKKQLMDMCQKNAQLLLEEIRIQKEKSGEWIVSSVHALQKDLVLPVLPNRIEAIDISNTAGQDAVGSLVVFENGRPKKSEYRKFRIRTVDGIDDYGMMAEVVERRYKRLVQENEDLPDLILVDGGKGQLSTALSVLKKLELSNQSVIGLAKRLEEVYIPGIPDPQSIPKSSPSLHLLQRIRDEAHRFAVQYHRSLRQKRSVKSILDDIPGIGEKRRNALIKAFGSVEGLKKVTVEDMIKVQGMNRTAAKRVAGALRRL